MMLPDLARLGTPGDRIEVVAPSSDWPALYAKEAERIERAGGEVIVSMEHVGSTAVANLAAKPILDIMVGLKRAEDGALLVPPMESLGYESRGEFGIPGRSFFVGRFEDRSVVHVHALAVTSREWRHHLVFRDRLRADASLRSAYAALKHELAARFRDDREGYVEGKAAFIQAALRGA